VNDEMIRRYGLEQAYTGGFKVYTTVPAKLQYAAQQAVMNNLHSYDERHGYRGVEANLWLPSEVIETEGKPETERVESLPVINENAWNIQQIDEHLAGVKGFGQISPAIVIAITEQTATIRLKAGTTTGINWDNLKWARPYINDNKSGRRVKKVADIFNDGALIWVRQNSNGGYRLAQAPSPSGALVAINPKNGAIRSIIGGYSYEFTQYNRATQAKRQVGSNIKPLIYSAALDNGHTLASLINDAPIHQWDKELGVAWRPKNSPPQYDGPIRIRVALAKSKNVVSVRLLKSVGLKNIVNHIEKFGIPREEIPQNDSLALGSASLTPLQVASSIATFANGGFLIEPYLIERIVDADEQVVYLANPMVACKTCEHELADNNNEHYGYPSKGDTSSNPNNPGNSSDVLTPVIPAPQIISTQNAFLVSQAMISTIWGGGDWNNKTGWNGTGFRAQKLKRRDLSGKTGTTNDAKDTWFSGFNQQVMVTTWVGFDNPSRTLGRTPAGSEAGARTAQPAWIEYMETALGDSEEQNLVIPEGIVSVRIDQQTGLLATKYDYTSRFEYFIRGTEPSEYADDDSVPLVIDNEGEGKVVEEDELF
ncbi:MAG: penicillin-binding protein 1A, partial [Alteromonadaceae bacterium]